MPNFQPTTTIYLCAGTGLDMQHSVWMHKYAYSVEADKTISWWNTLFQWFKCHSIAEGYWYYTYTDPSRGYVDVGRTPLSTGSRGQSGLGSSGKQAELNNSRVDYSEAIADIDYIVFANGDDGGTYDVKYGMVERIDYINTNVARVFFTIDAILTYQKYFELGRCFIDRDMQYDEWKSHGASDVFIPSRKNLNVQPESVGVNSTDYVLQRIEGGDENEDILKYLDLGSYSKAFVATDVDLTNIQSSLFNSSLPKFEPVASSKIGSCELGIGVYAVRDRINGPFKKLGEYNAFDHVLMSYTVPEKILKEGTFSQLLEFVKDDWEYVDSDYRQGADVTAKKVLRVPNHFNDNKITNLDLKVGDFRALNYKCYLAPLSYISISDKQGSSVEIAPQTINPLLPADERFYYELYMAIDSTVMPNIMSYLYIENLVNAMASKERPFMTLFQMPVYQMTPNGSGSGLMHAQAANQLESSFLTFFVISALAIGVIATGGALAGAGATVATGGAAVTGGAAGGALATAGKGLATLATTTGVSAVGNYVSAEHAANLAEKIALPKSAGGSISGMTKFCANNAGYEVYFCHLKTDLMKIADYMFSIIGYSQNCFRRPHINTRKRWCYVKLQNTNIVNIGGNNYIQGGTPFWARAQIEQRLANGVTFWNLRHALGDSVIDSYTDIPKSSINCNFVRNYGKSVDDEIVRDNSDHCDDYASDYSEET